MQKSAERVDFFTDTARYVYGDAIYGGFAASITYVIIGGLLLWKRDSIREFRKYTGTGGPLCTNDRIFDSKTSY